MVLSGAEHHGLATLAHTTVRLWERATAVAAENTGRPLVTSLRPPSPNPTRTAATLRFSLAQACPLRLNVYDVRGSLVRRLVDRDLPSGTYEISWDGRNREGRALPGGIYFVRMEAGDTKESRKVMLLR